MSSSGPTNVFRRDYPNAIKHNLDKWVGWRTELNQRLAESMLTGSPVKEIQPLAKHLKRGAVHIAVDNPKTLMTYSASRDNITQLEKGKFLNFGIPRVKRIQPGKPNSENGSTSSHSSPEEMQEMGPDYLDDDSPLSPDCPYEELPDNVRRGEIVSHLTFTQNANNTSQSHEQPKCYTTSPDYQNSNNHHYSSAGFNPNNGFSKSFYQNSGNQNPRHSNLNGQDTEYENLYDPPDYHDNPNQYQNSQHLQHYGSSGYSPIN